MSLTAVGLRSALKSATLIAVAIVVPLACAQLVFAQGDLNAPPSASFTATPNPVGVGQTVTFDAAASADPDGAITKYEWDLDGNGSFETDTGTSPTTSRSYASPGTVNVRLRVTDTGGATAQTTVAVEVENLKPIASFTASPNPVAVDQTVTFNAASSSDPDGTIVLYEWDLDNDRHFDDAVGVTATRSFSAVGSYTVRLRVTDSSGAKATATLTVTVSNAPPPPFNQSPVASFTASPNPTTTGQTVQFDAGASADPDGTIVSYAWDLDGDGSFEVDTGTNPAISMSYATAGTFNVRLRVTDDDGAIGLKSVVLVVENRVPVASFTASPNPATVGQAVQFNAGASSDPDGTIASYDWDLDDDGQFDDATGVTASGSFTTAGSHAVKLRVTDNLGATDTETVVVTVETGPPPPPPPNQAPFASFTASPNPATTGQTVQFSAGASSDPDGNITKYEWDLDGDGSFETATGTNPATSKSYSVAATLTVQLRVTDDDGATGLKSLVLVVENRLPVASFSASPNPAVVGEAVQFNAGASSDPDGTIASYAWDLDDDGQFDDATGVTASRSFATAASHTVTLQVTDNRGATDTAAVVVTVQAAPPPPNQAPVASFTASPNPAVTGQTVQFNAGASSDADGSIIKYEWDLDGNGSFETNGGAVPTASKSYAAAGAVTVRLRVTDDDGATAEKTVAVVVENRMPVASFTASPSPATVGQTVQFNAGASSDPDGTIASYAWDLDDDGQFDDATGVTASRSFPAAGSHTVRLRVTDNHGATDTAAVVVSVQNPPAAPANRPPVAAFTAGPNPAPAGTTVGFDASGSSDADGRVVGYEWDFDRDGRFDDATGARAAHLFDSPGLHVITLRVSDDDGATDVESRTIAIVFGDSASTPPALMTPFPVVRIAGRSTSSGAKITRLEVRGAPRGALVTVRCRGRGCRARQKNSPVVSNRMRFRAFERRLRAGAVIRVLVTQPGKIGKYTSFKIRRRKAPVRRDLCILAVDDRPSRCPSS